MFVCKPSLLYYYARLSRNTLDWEIKTKVERVEEEEEEDHLLVNVSIIGILKQKSYLYSKHSKDSNIEFPFPCFLASFGCYYWEFTQSSADYICFQNFFSS